MERFCPKCGKKTEKFYENLCLECYVEKKKLIPEAIELKRCKMCGRYFLSGKSFNSTETAVEYFLRKRFGKTEINNVSYRVAENGRVFVNLNGREFATKIEIENFICASCKKKFFIQAIVQIRGNEEFVKRMFDEVTKQIEQSKDRTLTIKKIENVKNGKNIYVSSKKGIRRIVKSLEKKYKLSIKISRKMVGVKDGRTQYKDFILVKE